MRPISGQMLLSTGVLLCIASSLSTIADASQQALHVKETVPILKAPEAFHEQLVLKPLNDGGAYSHFQFTTHIGTMMDEEHFDGAASNLFSHYNLFPRSIGQILHSFEVEELHLTFTQGRWQYSDWGYPLAPSVGTGVELWAWLNNNRLQAEGNWRGLTNTLSGLFCASLNFIDDTISIEPKLSFRNEGLYNVHSSKLSPSNTTSTTPRKLRYGSLPHENVCTENLTPWIKLLPCKSKSGIASLLKSHKLFDTRFYSMAIHVRPVCEDDKCKVKSLELVQTITTVFDVARQDGSYDWSLSSLFEREITQACPLASTSNIIVHLPQTTQFDKQYELTPMLPEGRYTIGSDENKQEIAVYDLKKAYSGDTSSSSEPFKLSMQWESSRPKSVQPISPGIVAHRYFTGYGQERGGLSIEIYNNDSQDVEAVLLDTLPWYLKLYLHTFTVHLNDQLLENYRDIVKKMYYQQAVDRARPAVLELALNLPSHSKIKFSISFDKVFLKYTEHPPDANRGFDIGYAVITVPLARQKGQIGYGSVDHLRIYQGRDASLVQSRRLSTQQQEGNDDDNETDKVRIYTETLLLSLPTPDFSMPYNVITLTCTVIALFFGSMFNLMTRNFEVVGSDKTKGKDKEKKDE
ncbi:hypothetical protein BX616_002432 [Lobosporangium transversale]|uniref:GPI transamidase component PIG-T n=1 Tax=Lobosporangium transversale TaxID=64571 RepID=A0A1Y2GZS9_9FUNG|nr:GPI transamidase component PIG-T [Lobosporangium transversale]KAF9900966.1 hypothetical protein BX616_002432 [Lobosporangium transversale]ORZ27294.1 GPI transamidase component PIG-T [Lobosporangium transversale]|eukprot:XP_021885021.1 GPI transamidase component PIG-T [Lobosporangium transversale]